MARRLIDKDALKKRNDKILALRASGMDLHLIAERFNLSVGAVQNVILRTPKQSNGESQGPFAPGPK